MAKKYNQLLQSININDNDNNKLSKGNENIEKDLKENKKEFVSLQTDGMNSINLEEIANNSTEKSILDKLKKTKTTKKISKSFYLETHIADKVTSMAKEAGVSENKVINTLLNHIFYD